MHCSTESNKNNLNLKIWIVQRRHSYQFVRGNQCTLRIPWQQWPKRGAIFLCIKSIQEIAWFPLALSPLPFHERDFGPTLLTELRKSSLFESRIVFQTKYFVSIRPYCQLFISCCLERFPGGNFFWRRLRLHCLYVLTAEVLHCGAARSLRFPAIVKRCLYCSTHRIKRWQNGKLWCLQRLHLKVALPHRKLCFSRQEFVQQTTDCVGVG